MTIYRIIKFLAGCGITSMLVVGCSGSGESLKAIDTPEQAQGAGLTIVSSLGSIGVVQPTAPEFQAVDQDPFARLQAIKAEGAALAARAKSFVEPVGPQPMKCANVDGSGTYTETYGPGSDYFYTEKAENCDKYADGRRYTGTYAESYSYGVNGLITHTSRYGNGDGITDAATDYTVIDSMGGTGVTDEDSITIFSDLMLGMEDYSTPYSGRIKRQYAYTDGNVTLLSAENSIYSGTESWNAKEAVLTDSYSIRDRRSSSFTLPAAPVDKAPSIGFMLRSPGSLEISRDLSGIREIHMDEGYTLDSPNGTISFNLTPPADDPEQDCNNVNGRFLIETIAPLQSGKGIFAPESSAAPLLVRRPSYFTAGELLINNNTTVVFSDGNVKITLDGTTVFDAPAEELMMMESMTCPLFLSVTDIRK